MIRFKKVIPSHQQVEELYSLLLKRKHSISHEKVPSFAEHEVFVSESPYLEWYLVYKGELLLGSVYVQSDNSIGVNSLDPRIDDLNKIFDFIKTHHRPLPAIKSVRRDGFFINIAPNNTKLLEICEKICKKEIQRSFLV
jgi:hypothetical protein